MCANIFEQLAPYLQEWIYEQGWTEFKPIQVEACKVLFNSNHHLLLSTGTASGKTEAALLPAITLIENDPPATIGILYISPMKALINDQYDRVDLLLEKAHFSVTRWHGDVPRGKKQSLIKDPRGILQITPESLEGMLINRVTDLKRLFGDLRFIIIDEVHVFLNGERGIQVQCQLERLGRAIGYHPRRLGLSATLGDYGVAAGWLAGNTGIPVETPLVGTETRTMRIALEHFIEPSYLNFLSYPGQPIGPNEPSHVYIYEGSLGKKCIAFTNSREATEYLLNGLRRIAKNRYTPDIYHAHHSCIAAIERESVESAMKEEDTPHFTVATVTLELGVDIGDVERIYQTEAPHAVTSFLQRMGRSGRKTGIPEIVFASRESPRRNSSFTPALPFRIPWGFLQTIGILQVYLEEQWLEPNVLKQAPFNVLYHQTMSTLASVGELSVQALAKEVLTLPPFSHLSHSVFRMLLLHLIDINHVERVEDGGLILGLEGEKIARNFRFLAVFRDYRVEYAVKHESREIAHVDSPCSPGEILLLAGYVWRVVDMQEQHKIIYVEPIEKKTMYYWPGDRTPVHTKILQRMRRALLEDTEFGYLQPMARERLVKAREFAKSINLSTNHAFKLKSGHWCFLPWLGTNSFVTLRRILQRIGGPQLGISNISPGEPRLLRPPPYYFTFDAPYKDPDLLVEDIVDICQSVENARDLIDPGECFLLERYHKFLPAWMQQEIVVRDRFDLEEVQEHASRW
ncbi:DEAD/DEAH box helicase [Candidatus Bathyarchaeota archaeon]|nr:DEAD/DEAH box helicase [Candidatus Bathyarchaeota archaeon]